MFRRYERIFAAICALVLAGCGEDIARLQADGSLTSARLDSVIALPRGVYVEGRMTIQAPPESVWTVFSAFNRWQDWNAGLIRAQSTEGDALEWGFHFTQTYKIKRVSVTVQSVVLRIIPGREAVWKSAVLGLRMLQAVSFRDAGEGRTEVICRERIAGLLPLLFRDRLRAEAQRTTQTALEGLRAFCEARYPTVAPPVTLSAPPSLTHPVDSISHPAERSWPGLGGGERSGGSFGRRSPALPDTTGEDTTAATRGE